MKHLFFLYIVLTISLFSSCNNKNAKLELSEKSLDFGKLVLGDTINRKVYIKNKGTASLIISKLEASCNCSIAKIQDNIVQINDSTYFDLIILPLDLGEFKKEVVIKSNDPEIFHIIDIEVYA